MHLFLQLFLYASPILAETFPPPPSTGVVVAVYDGDTYTLASGDKVRLRGANTPELKPPEEYGLEARDAVADLLLNQQVTLVYGESSRDGYGRLVASVQVKDTDVAEFILERGLGHAFFIPPESLDTNKLLAAQKKAQEENKGIWSVERYHSNLHMTSFHANAPGDDQQNINGEYIRVTNITADALNIEGYTITNLHGEIFTFPSMIIPAGNTFKVISGSGRNQSDPQKQLEVYLGSYRPIWNNEHDVATIYSPEKKVQDSREHKPKTKPKD